MAAPRLRTVRVSFTSAPDLVGVKSPNGIFIVGAFFNKHFLQETGSTFRRRIAKLKHTRKATTEELRFFKRPNVDQVSQASSTCTLVEVGDIRRLSAKLGTCARI